MKKKSFQFENLESRLVMAACIGGSLSSVKPSVFELQEITLRLRLTAETEGTCNVQGPLTIDLGDGREIVREPRSFNFSETTYIRTTYVQPGAYTLNAELESINLTHEIEIRDWKPSEIELNRIRIDLDDSTSGSEPLDYWRIWDRLEVTSVFSVDTANLNEGRFGTLSDDLTYTYTDEVLHGFNQRRESFLVGICDDEQNCVSKRLDVWIDERVADLPPIAGDVNGDRLVDTSDRDAFFLEYSDANHDGSIDEFDVELMRQRFRIPVGDVNLDGVFDSSDLIILFQVGRYEQSASGWGAGDFDADGFFDTSDLIAAFQDGKYQ